PRWPTATRRTGPAAASRRPSAWPSSCARRRGTLLAPVTACRDADTFGPDMSKSAIQTGSASGPLILAPIARGLAVTFAIAACSGPAPVAPPAPAPKAKAETIDICKDSPPVPHSFSGVLRNARCDQDMYISMASVADQLGVECTHCHATKTEDRT